jgi:hypothetical protein
MRRAYSVGRSAYGVMRNANAKKQETKTLKMGWDVGEDVSLLCSPLMPSYRLLYRLM